MWHSRLSFLFFVLAIVPAHLLSEFNVHYVDSTQASDIQNFLFRGGTGESDWGTDFPALIEEIQQVANDAGIKLPEEFIFIDICLLNLETVTYNSGDRNESIEEWTFFQKNPTLGQFVFWETQGSFDNATNPLIQPMINNIMTFADNWLPDRLHVRMQSLRQMLYTQYDKPAVLYGHCDCGCDRTGEVFGSYYMKWLNISWEETNLMNRKAAGRYMDCFNYQAMQWYCLYLNWSEGRNLNCLREMGCSKQKVCLTITENGTRGIP